MGYTGMKVKCNIHPVPIGRITTYDLEYNDGDLISDFLPENFSGYVRVNGRKFVIDYSQKINGLKSIDIFAPVRGGGGGGDDKEGLRTFAMISLAVASFYAGPAAAAFFNGSKFAGAVATAALTIGGSALINQLIPIQQQDTAQQADYVEGVQIRSLEASRNMPSPYSPFPKVYGTRRIRPPYAATPNTEIIGDDQYIHLLYFLNYGPISIMKDDDTNIKIGHYRSSGANFNNYEEYDQDSYDFKAGTFKIDQTNIESFPEWEIKIGSVEHLEDLEIPMKDVSLDNVDISFQSSFVEVLSSPITIYGLLPAEREEVVDLDVGDRGEIFRFRATPSEWGRAYRAKFKLYYEKTADYLSDTWNQIEPPKELAQNYPIGDLTVPGIWLAKESNVAFDSGVVDVGEEIARLKFEKIVKSSSEENSNYKIDSIKMFNKDDIIETTAVNTYAAGIELIASNGLYTMDNLGNRERLRLEYLIQYREVTSPTPPWTTVEPIKTLESGASSAEKYLVIEGETSSTVRSGVYFRFPSAAQYDIRIVPKNYPSHTGYMQDGVVWENLKSYQNETKSIWAPYIDDASVPEDHPHYDDLKENCVMAYVKLKAVPMLNGNVDRFSVLLTGMVKDIASYTTSYTALNHDPDTSGNPANVYADIFLGGNTAATIERDRLDWDLLKSWHTWIETWGFYYSNYETIHESVISRVARVASVALGKFGVNNELFSIIRDIKDQTPIQQISPNNSIAFSAQKSYVDALHAVKVQYTDDSTWEKHYTVIYNTGYDLDGSDGNTAATLFETIDIEGITSLDHAQRYGRYHLANITLRPELYTLTMDIENLRCQAGDVVNLSHDTLRVGETFGRVLEISRNGSSEVVYVRVDEDVLDVTPDKAITFRHDDGTVSASPLAVDEGSTTTNVIYLETPVVISALNVGDLFVYGDSDALLIECKVSKIVPGPDMTATLCLVNNANEIHDTYEAETIPAYTPVIDSRAETGLKIPPKPVITSIVSGDNYVITSESRPEPLGMRINYYLPYTGVDVKEIGVDLLCDVLDSVTNISATRTFQFRFPYIKQKSYVLVPAFYDAKYEVKLFASTVDDFGITRVSEPDTDTHETEEPPAMAEPASVSYEKSEGNTIRLVWTEVEAAFPVVYVVGFYDSSVPEWDVIGTTHKLSYDIGERFSTDTYGVAALNVKSGVMSGYEDITLSETEPTVGTITAEIFGNKIKLTWSRQSSEIVQYEVREATSGAYDWATASLVEKTNGTVSIIEKTSTGTYYFTIKGRLADGWETDQANQSAAVGATAPSSLSNTVVSDNYKLTWNYTGDVDYSYFRVKAGSSYGAAVTLGTTANLYFTDTGTTIYANYYVETVDVLGNTSSYASTSVTFNYATVGSSIGVSVDPKTQNLKFKWGAFNAGTFSIKDYKVVYTKSITRTVYVDALEYLFPLYPDDGTTAYVYARDVKNQLSASLSIAIPAEDLGPGERVNYKTDTKVTVGSGGDFSTIGAALEYLAGLYPGYENDGFNAEIELKTGFELEEAVVVDGINLGWIRITSVDAVVNVDNDAVRGDSSYYCCFYGTNSAVMPRIETQFRRVAGMLSSVWGVRLAYGASMFMDGGGFDNFLVNCEIDEGSSIVAIFSDFTDGEYGIVATSNSNVTATGCDMSSCTYGVWLSTASTGNFNLATADSCTIGMSVSGSNVSATYFDAKGCSTLGLDAGDGSSVSVQLSDFSGSSGGCVLADHSAKVHLQSADCSGGTTYGIKARYGGQIDARLANCQIGGSPSSSDIVVSKGGLIFASGATGGLSQTANTVTSDGIIFQE